MKEDQYRELMDKLYQESDALEMRLGRYVFEKKQLESEIDECFQELHRLEREKEALFMQHWESQKKTYGGDEDVHD